MKGIHEIGCATTIRLRLYPPRSAWKSPAQVINTSRGDPVMSKTSSCVDQVRARHLRAGS